MVQLYDAYSRPEFADLVVRMQVDGFARPQIMPVKATEIVPIEMAQLAKSEIVPFEMAQIPNVLFATGWTNHQIIMSRCKKDEEQLKVGGVLQRSLAESCRCINALPK